MNMILLLNEKNKKNKSKNGERKGVEEELDTKVKTVYEDNIIKNSSLFIDNKILEELSKLLIESFNRQINDFNDIIGKIVKDTMTIQSLNIMKNFNFE